MYILNLGKMKRYHFFVEPDTRSNGWFVIDSKRIIYGLYYTLPCACACARSFDTAYFAGAKIYPLSSEDLAIRRIWCNE